MNRISCFGLLLGSLLAVTAAAHATQYYVQPGDSIQAAINSAQTGDEVILVAGTHSQHSLLVLGKNITIRSSDPNNPAVVAATIIDCMESGRAITFQSSQTLVTNQAQMLGVTITNGCYDVSDPNVLSGGGAILCDHAGPTIRNCVLEYNKARGTYLGGKAIGGAVLCLNCIETTDPNSTQPRIETNTIRYNQAVRLTPEECGVGRGGGIACIRSSPTIVGNAITNNVAGATEADEPCGTGSRSTCAAWSSGGGIFVFDGSSPIIEDNFIGSNLAQNLQPIEDGCDNLWADGGGLATQDDVYGCFPVIRRNVFESNVAIVRMQDAHIAADVGAMGGACSLDSGVASGGFQGNRFTGNRAEVRTWSSDPNFVVFVNHARAAGGALWIGGDNIVVESYNVGGTQIVTEITGNVATVENVRGDIGYSAWGGGIALSGASVAVKDAVLTDNQALAGDSATEDSGSLALWVPDGENWKFFPAFGGGIGMFGAYGTIENCVLVRNEAAVSGSGPSLGGAIALAGVSWARVSGSTIAENEADYGGGVGATDWSEVHRYITGQDVYRGLWSTILWNNVATTANRGPQAAVLYFSILTVDYCDVEGGQTDIYVDPVDPSWYTLNWGTGNFDADPLFVFPGGNYHLRGTSPCINTGDPNGVYTGQVDMDFQSRVLNSRIDVGADEFGPIIIYADMNCDGLVNFGDINAFVEAIQGQAQYEAAYPNCRWLNADLNGDGTVGFADINIFIDWIT